MTNMLERLATFSAYYDAEIISKYHSIRQNLDYSKHTLLEIQSKFGLSALAGNDQIVTIAVAGSFARLEAYRESDFDVLVVLKNESDQEKIHEQVLSFIGDLGYDRPNSKGVFAHPTSIDKLKTVAGNAEETYGDLSRRMLMLLESAPVLQKNNYFQIKKELIDIYAEDVLNEVPLEAATAGQFAIRNFKNFVFLLNDIIRYFRTICVNYQYTKVQTEWGKWPIRNIKLRHSRVIMYISLVAAIGCLSRHHESDKVEALRALINAEPLRRLFMAYQLSNDDGFFRLAEYYNVFLDALNNKEIRGKLAGIDYHQRYDSREFAVLKANSDALASELLRFVFSKKDRWNDRFFEYLLF